MQLNMFSSCQLEELMDTGPVSVSGNWLLHFVFFCPVWSLWLTTRPSDGTLTVLSWSVTRMVGGYGRFAPEISSKPKRSLIISCLNWSKLKWRGIWRYDQTVLNNRLPSRGQATQFGFKKTLKEMWKWSEVKLRWCDRTGSFDVQWSCRNACLVQFMLRADASLGGRWKKWEKTKCQTIDQKISPQLI